MQTSDNKYQIEIRQLLEQELQNNETLLEYTYGSLYYSFPSATVHVGLTSERIVIILKRFLSKTKTYSIPVSFIRTISWDSNFFALKIELLKDSIQIKCRDLWAKRGKKLINKYNNLFNNEISVEQMPDAAFLEALQALNDLECLKTAKELYETVSANRSNLNQNPAAAALKQQMGQNHLGLQLGGIFLIFPLCFNLLMLNNERSGFSYAALMVTFIAFIIFQLLSGKQKWRIFGIILSLISFLPSSGISLFKGSYFYAIFWAFLTIPTILVLSRKINQVKWISATILFLSGIIIYFVFI